MKLLILNPNTTASITQRLLRAAQEVCSPDTTLYADQVPSGPPAITTELDELCAQVEVLKYLDRHSGQYDGAIVGCFGDPGVQLAKGRYSIPVLGIAESAYHMACLAGRGFSVLSTGTIRESRLTWDMLERCGLKSRCRQVHPLGLELTAVSDSSLPQIQACVKRMLEVDGCDSVVLACSALAGMGGALAKTFGVPFFDGVQQAVLLLEGMLQARYASTLPPLGGRDLSPLPFSR